MSPRHRDHCRGGKGSLIIETIKRESKQSSLKLGRVEEKRGAIVTRFSSPLIKPDVPISSIRLSDGLHVQPTQGASTSLQPHNAEFPIHDLRGKPPRPTTPVALMSPPQKVPYPIIDVGVDLPVGLVQAPIAEVRFPSPQLLVQLVAHLLPWAYLTRLQQIIYRLLEFPDRLIGWPGCRVPPTILPMPHRSECVTQKVERFPSGILNARLGFIQSQADPAHHLTRPFPRLRRMSATEYHEIVRVVYDDSPILLALSRFPPVFEIPVHVQVRQQRTDDSTLWCALPLTSRHSPIPLIIP